MHTRVAWYHAVKHTEEKLHVVGAGIVILHVTMHTSVELSTCLQEANAAQDHHAHITRETTPG